MKRNNIFKNIALMSALIVGFTACEKPQDVDPIGDRGQTLVKMIDGGAPGHVLSGIDFVNRSQEIDVADVRRDVPNTAEMNRTMNVVVKDDTAALKQYNIDNSSNLKIMPSSWYTLNIPRSGPGGTYNMVFAPGELAKQITITIPDATLLDPSATYGFPFTIVSADAGANLSVSKTIIYEIGAKNAYDGIYTVVSGNVQRYTAGVPEPAGGLNGPLAGNPDVVLITTGANTVKIPLPGPGSIQWAAGNNSYVAGIDGITLTIDPVTYLVTAAASGNATFANWAGFTNSYNPATKTFTLAWRWNPTGNTREYQIVLKYKGAR